MRTITLRNGLGLYNDNAPFAVSDLEIKLSGLPADSAEYRYIAFMNGKRFYAQAVSATENRVKLSADKLSAGRFSCCVEGYQGGVCVRKYRVEDLLITETLGSLEAAPEIAALFRRVETLEALECAVKALEIALKGETDARAELEKRLATLEENADIFGN